MIKKPWIGWKNPDNFQIFFILHSLHLEGLGKATPLPGDHLGLELKTCVHFKFPCTSAFSIKHVPKLELCWSSTIFWFSSFPELRKATEPYPDTIPDCNWKTLTTSKCSISPSPLFPRCFLNPVPKLEKSMFPRLSWFLHHQSLGKPHLHFDKNLD